MTLQDRMSRIAAVLDTNKAEDVESFDLTDTGYMVDGVVIGTAMADRHLSALLDFLRKALKGDEQFLNVDESDDWTVVDMGDILVHIMTAGAREKYHMEAFLQEFEAKRNQKAQ